MLKCDWREEIGLQFTGLCPELGQIIAQKILADIIAANLLQLMERNNNCSKGNGIYKIWTLSSPNDSLEKCQNS
jgi:hypothetical protein